ncbi:MAG: hypothetical protein Q9208_002471 [Pyrenodesmia sp. 3 TL-2023]
MSADWMSGLEVKQYGNEYEPQYNTNGIKEVEWAVYGWQVTFARTNMRFLRLQEYDVKSWVESAPENATRTFCVIRFLYVEPVTGTDVSELPANNTTMAVQTSGFPLAKLCSDNEALKGKEIRLAFPKPSSNLKRTYSWQWPKAIHMLSNSFGRDTVDDALNKGPLNTWAEGNKDRLERVTLSKVEAEGKVEWRMHKKNKSVSDHKRSTNRRLTILHRPPLHPAAETSTDPAPRPREEDHEEAFDAETDRLEREWRKAVASSEEAHEMVREAQRESSRRDKAEKAAQSAFIVRRKQREDRFGQYGGK